MQIERMRASAPETENPYRASYQTPSYPPAVPKQRQTPLDARQVSPVANKPTSSQVISAATVDSGSGTVPEVLQIKNPNLTKTATKPPQSNRTWSEQSTNSGSIDSYLVDNLSVVDSFSAVNQDSLNLVDPRSFTKSSTSQPLEQKSTKEKSNHENHHRQTIKFESSPPVSKGLTSHDLSIMDDARVNPLSSFKMLPSNLRKPRERATPQMIPQLDGCTSSKPYREDDRVQEEQRVSPIVRDTAQRPRTPELHRHESTRSSICRSPAWSVTNGERGRQLEEERRSRKKAAKEAKALREKQEKEQKAIREREEKERGREAKAAIKQQKKLSKPPLTPRKLTKGDRSNSMPAIPMASRLNPGSRTNSFQSIDGSTDTTPSRRSFQAKPAIVLPATGFIGGLKLDKARKAALDQHQLVDTEGNAVVVDVFVPERRFDLDDGEDEEFEKDMVRNAYHLALNDRPVSHTPPVEALPINSQSKRQTIAGVPPSKESAAQNVVDFLGKPKSPFYQIAPASNSFVDEIFHTIQNKGSQSSEFSQAHPLRSNPSVEFLPNGHQRGSFENLKPDRTSATSGSKDEPNYNASSFAVRMAKKSGSLDSTYSKTNTQEDSSSSIRSQYGNHLSAPSASSSLQPLRPERLAAVVATEVPNASVQHGKRHQVKVLESVNTKSHSMLIERLSVAESDQADNQEKAEERAEVIVETKRDSSKTRNGRSSSRDWFRRSAKDESKPTIQERRRSRSAKPDSQASNRFSVNSGNKSEAEEVNETAKGEKPRNARRNSISPTINSFKAAAKAAFSKYGPAAPSSQANLPSSPLNANRPVSSDGGGVSTTTAKTRRQTLPSSVTMPSMGKADKILGENLSSMTVNSRRASAERAYESTSSSVTTKGSDEEVSSSPEDVDNNSNITTPTVSRPTSKKEHLLTLKAAPSSVLPGGRFREEFSPEFLSALDRGKFDLSPMSNNSSALPSPAQDVSSIQHTPITSPTEPEIKISGPKLNDGDSLIADAIARVEKFTLSGGKMEATTAPEESATTKNNEIIEAYDANTTKIDSLASDQNITTNNAFVPESNLTRQPSIKSASTSNLASTKPELDFSFLPTLKHESLTRPPRVSASPSLQAIAASLLGPASTKTSPKLGSAGSSRNASPLASPSIPGTPSPLPSPSAARPSGTRHSSLPPQNRISQPADENLSPSVKDSWLAAISGEKSPAAESSKARSITSLVQSSVETLRSHKSSSSPAGSTPKFELSSNILKHPSGGSLDDPYAKIFFICCGCKRYHDLPAKVYQKLIHRGMGGNSGGLGNGGNGKGGKGKEVMKEKEEDTVCIWCRHEMTTDCCENWAVCLKLMEKLG